MSCVCYRMYINLSGSQNLSIWATSQDLIPYCLIDISFLLSLSNWSICPTRLCGKLSRTEPPPMMTCKVYQRIMDVRYSSQGQTSAKKSLLVNWRGRIMALSSHLKCPPIPKWLTLDGSPGKREHHRVFSYRWKTKSGETQFIGRTAQGGVEESVAAPGKMIRSRCGVLFGHGYKKIGATTIYEVLVFCMGSGLQW